MLAVARLSFSLLVSSAVFLASAALDLPVQSSQPELLAPAKLASAALPNQPSPDLLVLTPENFDFAIAQGVWCVLSFSHSIRPSLESAITLSIAGSSNTPLLIAYTAKLSPRHGPSSSKPTTRSPTLAFTSPKSTVLPTVVGISRVLPCLAQQLDI